MKQYLTCPEYEQLKASYISGWKTWNVNSVFSYVHLPDALTLSLHFKEYRDGNFLRDALIGRFPTGDPEDATEVLYPGDHAADDSYTSMKIEWCGFEALVETAAAGDTFALLVTPLTQQCRPVRICLEAGFMFNRPGSVRMENGVLRANSGTAEGVDAETAGEGSGGPVRNGSGTWRILTSGSVDESDLNLPLTGPYVSVLSDAPVAFLAMADPDREDIGKDEVLGFAKALVEEKKSALAARCRKAGDLEWAMQAMECAVSWDTVYDANRSRVISPVSRLWSIRKGGYVLFCWDNFFAGYMAGFYGRELAYSNVIEIVNERTDKGFIPNMSCGNGQKTQDRSQPPVGSRMVLELYRKYEELWLVELLYPALLEWNTWFYRNRRSDAGALCWGSDPAPVIFGNRWEKDGVHERFGGALESGLDNSPMYDDVPFDPDRNCLMLEDVGLTGLYIMDCKALEELAKLLGKTQDAALLARRRGETQQGLDQLWDEEKGFYYNRRTDTGEFSRRISPTNFYALFSENVPEERIARILKEHYYNPEEFYGEWMLPSIARDDPAFTDQDYWRGRVWAPMNFLVYLAFEQHRLTRECSDLAGKSVDIFLPEWLAHRHVHENYNAITGEGCDAHNSDKFYHWGALLAAIALRNRGIR